MVEQKASSEQQQQPKPQAEQTQPQASGGATGPESVPATGTRRCFASTGHGSQLLLFVSPTMDAKHVLAEIVRRHNLQCKDLGRIRGKCLALCKDDEDKKGHILTNEMILLEAAGTAEPIYLHATTEDATLAAKRAAPNTAEGDPQAPKKTKAATPANAAAGASGTTPADGSKRRGRPTNKEKAEKEAVAAAKAAEEGKLSVEEKGKAPATAQVANETKPAATKSAAAAAKPAGASAKPAAAAASSVKKEAKAKPQAAQATPTEQKQSAKAPAQTPAAASASAPKKEESSSEESGSDEGSDESSEESSSEEEVEEPEASKQQSSSEESSSEEE